MVTVAQFTDATRQTIGAPSTNAAGLANAANQAQVNLADVSTGLAAAFWTTYDVNVETCTLVECGVLEPSNASGNLLAVGDKTPGSLSNSCIVLRSVAPPVNCDGLERLDTFANILAARIQTSGPSSAACTTLLGDTGSSSTTLQAAHYLATNPGGTTNIADLFALQSGSPPFTPALSSTPDGAGSSPSTSPLPAPLYRSLTPWLSTPATFGSQRHRRQRDRADLQWRPRQHLRSGGRQLPLPGGNSDRRGGQRLDSEYRDLGERQRDRADFQRHSRR
jgi:hypothetical protein